MRWKKNITTIKTSTTKKARQAYGPEAIDITDDVSQSDLDLKYTISSMAITMEC
jgi:hypothetical protein